MAVPARYLRHRQLLPRREGVGCVKWRHGAPRHVSLRHEGAGLCLGWRHSGVEFRTARVSETGYGCLRCVCVCEWVWVSVCPRWVNWTLWVTSLASGRNICQNIHDKSDVIILSFAEQPANVLLWGIGKRSFLSLTLRVMVVWPGNDTYLKQQQEQNRQVWHFTGWHGQPDI